MSISETKLPAVESGPLPARRAAIGQGGIGLRKVRWWEGLFVAGLWAMLVVVGWWQFPVEVAERRGHRRVRGIFVLTLLGVVCPVLWVVALAWGAAGKRKAEG
jgi:hypothetical protein